ncbi:MAG TPA: F0F1 ATP synthase subunit epsilon [bacterium]|nr:F0F1 ATP synthase subunit epsilon [bacterium]
MARDQLTVEIVTPTSAEETRQVSYLRAPGVDGLFGVLPGHIPAMIALDIGEIGIEQQSGQQYWATSGGYAEIHRDRVVLLVETAELATKIDVERAKSSAQRARRRLKDADRNPDIDPDRARHSLQRALNRLSIVEERG